MLGQRFLLFTTVKLSEVFKETKFVQFCQPFANISKRNRLARFKATQHLMVFADFIMYESFLDGRAYFQLRSNNPEVNKIGNDFTHQAI